MTNHTSKQQNFTTDNVSYVIIIVTLDEASHLNLQQQI